MSASHSSSSTSYTTFTSSSTTNGHTQTTAHRSGESYTTDPAGNVTVNRATQSLGEPVVAETRQYDAQGRELVGGGGGSGAAIEGGSGAAAGRIEDVTDERQKENDRRYEEAMEEEYAKREGGA